VAGVAATWIAIDFVNLITESKIFPTAPPFLTSGPPPTVSYNEAVALKKLPIFLPSWLAFHTQHLVVVWYFMEYVDNDLGWHEV
jgi:hypothetical protein